MTRKPLSDFQISNRVIKSVTELFDKGKIEFNLECQQPLTFACKYKGAYLVLIQGVSSTVVSNKQLQLTFDSSGEETVAAAVDLFDRVHDHYQKNISKTFQWLQEVEADLARITPAK